MDQELTRFPDDRSGERDRSISRRVFIGATGASIVLIPASRGGGVSDNSALR